MANNIELLLEKAKSELFKITLESLQNLEGLLKNPKFYSLSSAPFLNLHRSTANGSNKIKPDASLQDIMRHYIDIYDERILKSSARGTDVIPMNTGNPGFFPFVPVIQALQKNLHENSNTYAQYMMQVPDVGFCSKVSKYCHDEQILPRSKTLTPDNVVIGNGSTNLYYLSLKSIIKNKGDIILMTRPTYGLFIDPVFTAGGELGFIDLTEKNSWKLAPNLLGETIQFYNQKSFYNYLLNTFVKKYTRLIQVIASSENIRTQIVSLPIMPIILSNTKEIIDFKTFDNYVLKLNKFIEQIDIANVEKAKLTFSCPPRVRGFYHMNPHNPTGAVYSKKELEPIAVVLKNYPDITIIDDLAHWGILYDNSTCISSLSAIDTLFERTVTLMSLSKSYCLPGLRAGIAIGPYEIIKGIQYSLLNSNSSASVPAVIALDAVFSTPKADRDHYLTHNSNTYCFRRDLMATLINGFEKSELSFRDQIKVILVALQSHYKNDKAFDIKQLIIMLSPMPLVRTLTRPTGCFFHLLDVSKLIGSKVGSVNLNNATDVRNTFHTYCNVDVLPGELSANFFNYTLRLSFSLNEQEIYVACERIKLFIIEHILKLDPTQKMLHSKEKSELVYKNERSLALTINRAIIIFYLEQAKDLLLSQYDTDYKVNYLLNKEKLKNVKEKIEILIIMIEKLSVQDNSDTIYNQTDQFIYENKVWLKKLIPDFDQLELLNRELLNHSVSSNKVTKTAPGSFLKSAL